MSEEDEMQFGPAVTPSGYRQSLQNATFQSRIVPLSERQQMVLLKRIEENRKQATSPKPDNPQAQSNERDPNRKLYNKLNKRNDRGETALHRATIKGDMSKVHELLTQGADVNCKDFAGWTALHEACNHGYYDIVKMLIDHGADVNVHGLDGDTPLHDAAANGHEDITIVLIQSGGNPEVENDTKETPIEVADEEETRRLLLEGIPIYKDFERRRRRERERLRKELHDQGKSDDSSDPNRRDRNSSDFSSEDDLPLSGFQKSDSKNKGKDPANSSTSDKLDKESKTDEETNEKSSAAVGITIDATIARPQPTASDHGHADMSRKDDKKKTKEKIEDPEERRMRKLKKKQEREKVREESDNRSREERERKWREEIVRKIQIEAQEKGIDLTQEQLEKVCDRRMKKLRKKMDEKKKEREIRDESRQDQKSGSGNNRQRIADSKRKMSDAALTSSSGPTPNTKHLPMPELIPSTLPVPVASTSSSSASSSSLTGEKRFEKREKLDKLDKLDLTIKTDVAKPDKGKSGSESGAKKSPVVLPKFPPADLITPKREKKDSTDGSEKDEAASSSSNDKQSRKSELERLERDRKRDRREKEKEREKKRTQEEEKQKATSKSRKELAEVNFLGVTASPDMLKMQREKQKKHKEKQIEIRERDRRIHDEIKRQKKVEEIKKTKEKAKTKSSLNDEHKSGSASSTSSERSSTLTSGSARERSNSADHLTNCSVSLIPLGLRELGKGGIPLASLRGERKGSIPISAHRGEGKGSAPVVGDKRDRRDSLIDLIPLQKRQKIESEGAIERKGFSAPERKLSMAEIIEEKPVPPPPTMTPQPRLSPKPVNISPKPVTSQKPVMSPKPTISPKPVATTPKSPVTSSTATPLSPVRHFPNFIPIVPPQSEKVIIPTEQEAPVVAVDPTKMEVDPAPVKPNIYLTQIKAQPVEVVDIVTISPPELMEVESIEEHARSKEMQGQSETPIQCEPTVMSKTEPEVVPEVVPVVPKKPFKPKHAWLTEAADAAVAKRIEEVQQQPLHIEPLATVKLSHAILNRFTPERVSQRKTVHDESLNDYDERYCIKERIKRDWHKIRPIVPSAPDDYWNFSMLTGNYHLDTSMQDRLSFPKHAPPSNLHPKLKDLFKHQEETRWKMQQLHCVQREKLRLAYEQEIMRVHCNAKRLQENLPKPYSATMFLTAVYENQYENTDAPPQENEGNKRDRYTPRVLKAMVDEVVAKFTERKDKLLNLQRMERESTYMMQVTEWLLRAQAFDRAYLGKSIAFVKDIYVPKLNNALSDSFSLQV